ncbi:MAG: HAD family hydrolase [Dorea sp.]
MKDIKIEALVFDMDGLLLDSERIVQRAWEEAGNQLGIPGMGELIYHTLGMNRTARRDYFFSVVGPDFPNETFNQKNRECFFDIVEKEGLPVKKGARELLDYAKEHGYKLAVATSSSMDYARKVLEDAKIYDYFDGIIFGNMVTRSKPDPEIYLKVCELIQVHPSNCLALEDAPGGIRSAYAAGLHPIMIPDLVEPTEEVGKLLFRRYDSLLDVVQLLKERQ